MTASYLSTVGLEQAIRNAATGAVLSLDRRRRQLDYDRLQELTLSVQIPIFGTSSSGLGWKTVGVPFGIEFAYAPNQRDVPFKVPHFTYGVVCQGRPVTGSSPDPNNPNSLVGVFVQVLAWSRDLGKDIINGAQVGIGVTQIGGHDVDYDGYVHMTFWGYGAPIEDAAALDVGQ